MPIVHNGLQYYVNNIMLGIGGIIDVFRPGGMYEGFGTNAFQANSNLNRTAIGYNERSGTVGMMTLYAYQRNFETSASVDRRGGPTINETRTIMENYFDIGLMLDGGGTTQMSFPTSNDNYGSITAGRPIPVRLRLNTTNIIGPK